MSIFRNSRKYFQISIYQSSVEFTSQNFTQAMESKNCQMWQVLHFHWLKINKIQKKKHKGCCSLLEMMLGHWLHGLCTFLNMVINTKAARILEKSEKNNRHNVAYCWQCWGTVYMVCILQNIVINANIGRKPWKIRKQE